MKALRRILPILLTGCDLFAVSTRSSEVLTLTAPLSEIVVGSTLQLIACGGVPPYSFSVENSLVMGSIDSTSGLYTGPLTETLNLVYVTDSVGTSASSAGGRS